MGERGATEVPGWGIVVKILRRTKFGNPLLRQMAQRLSTAEIRSPEVQDFIASMRYTVEQKKYGVGLAAPQVGESLEISVIDIKPTPSRPGLESFQTVIINPEMWCSTKSTI